MRREVLPIAVLILSVLFVFYAAKSEASSNPERDFHHFWYAAHHLTDNPHVEAGSRYPPWTLVLILPLRLLDYSSAFGVWTVLALVGISASGRILWAVHTSKQSLIPAFLSLVFGPTLALLGLGQFTFIVLFGVALFFLSIERARYWLAGLSLFLISTKPHLTMVLLTAAFLWLFDRKKWRVLLGLIVSLALSTTVILFMNHRVFSLYWEFTKIFVQENQVFPSIGGCIAYFTNSHLAALLPEAAGLIWIVLYYYRRRKEWDWRAEGALVVLVSISVSYYSFPYDEVLVIPALVELAIRGRRLRFLPIYFVLNLTYMIYLTNERFWKYGNPLLICWLSSAWLLAYLFSRTAKRHTTQQITASRN